MLSPNAMTLSSRGRHAVILEKVEDKDSSQRAFMEDHLGERIGIARLHAKEDLLATVSYELAFSLSLLGFVSDDTDVVVVIIDGDEAVLQRYAQFASSNYRTSLMIQDMRNARDTDELIDEMLAANDGCYVIYDGLDRKDAMIPPDTFVIDYDARNRQMGGAMRRYETMQ